MKPRLATREWDKGVELKEKERGAHSNAWCGELGNSKSSRKTKVPIRDQ